MDVIIDSIGKDHNLRFIYDKEHLHRYKASFDPTLNHSNVKYGNLGSSLRWNRKINDKLSMNLLASFSNFYATRDQSRTMSYKKDGVKEEISTGTLETNDLYDVSLKNDWRCAGDEPFSGAVG